MSKPTEPHKPAFPANVHDAGLTKREYFAAMALQGLCANPEWTNVGPFGMANAAENFADELIKRLNEDPK